MTALGWTQIALFSLLILAVTKPLGVYMYEVFEGQRRPHPRLLVALERLLYRLSGVNSAHEQSWQMYTFALLAFSALTLVVTYAIERLQHALPLNPQGLAAVPEHLAFNTAASVGC